MNPLIPYLAKVSLMYLMFFLVYWVLFRKETFFIRNRIYLFICLILPVVIPLIHFPENSPVTSLASAESMSWILVMSNIMVTPPSMATAPVVQQPISDTSPINWSSLILLIYLSGVLIFLFRMIWAYSGIIRMIARSDRKRLLKMILVITKVRVSPFSIFRWLVVPAHKQQHADLEKIILHEMVHFRQWHSIDLLLSELLIVFQWFNPFAWMLKSSIVSNNEFFVDHRLVSGYTDIKSYQYALLSSSVGERRIVMANRFNQGLIKKRIEMMNKKKTRLINRIKDLLIVPFAAILVLAFSAYSPKLAVPESNPAGPSILADQPAAGFQDQVTQKDTSKGVSIFFNGKKLTIKYLEAAKDSTGDIRILRWNNLGETWSVLSKEKLEELLKNKEIRDDSTLYLVRKSKKAGHDDAYLGVITVSDSAKVDKCGVFMGNDKDKIKIYSKQGKHSSLFVVSKGGKGVNLYVSNDGTKKNMLFVVDDKVYESGEWNFPDPDTIDIITIIDSVEAAKKYGEKAKNGVVVIKTRKKLPV
jgi:bla regulator protein blaR1